MLSVKFEKCGQTEVVYITVKEGQSVKTEPYDKGETIILDFDVADNLLGIEIIELGKDTESLLASIVEDYDIEEMRGHFKIDKLKEAFA